MLHFFLCFIFLYSLVVHNFGCHVLKLSLCIKESTNGSCSSLSKVLGVETTQQVLSSSLDRWTNIHRQYMSGLIAYTFALNDVQTHTMVLKALSRLCNKAHILLFHFSTWFFLSCSYKHFHVFSFFIFLFVQKIKVHALTYFHVKNTMKQYHDNFKLSLK